MTAPLGEETRGHVFLDMDYRRIQAAVEQWWQPFRIPIFLSCNETMSSNGNDLSQGDAVTRLSHLDVYNRRSWRSTYANSPRTVKAFMKAPRDFLQVRISHRLGAIDTAPQGQPHEGLQSL